MTQTHPADLRLAHQAWRTLRQDLFADVFAYDPLPPADAAPRSMWARLLPKRLRRHLRWTPHTVVGAFAGLFLLVGAEAQDGIGNLVLCAVASGAVALTLLRPVGAFWISLALFALGQFTATSYAYVAPWVDVTLICHPVVLVLVTLRTRPRLALEMWLLTVAAGVLVSAFGGGNDVPPLAVISALLLIAAAALRAWRDERRHVAESETVTAQERSRRTFLEERATIARELHDVMAHHMSVIAIQAEAAPYRVEELPPELAAPLATIRENAVAALTELRRILGVVRSDDPDAFADGAPEAPQPTLADLPSLLDGLRASGLSAELVVTGAVRALPQGVELSAYRIVQEALSNVLRHAPGAEARVEVSYVLGGLGLRIVNGQPSRLAKASPGAGHGLLGMRERVQMLGGELTAETTEDGGYEVAVFVPASPREPAGAPAEETERTGDTEDGAA
jgi:signal transduction histidine kinase